MNPPGSAVGTDRFRTQACPEETISGTVLEIVDDNGERYAVVAVESAVACARCAEGRGCGAGLFASQADDRRIRALIATDEAVASGDRVEVGFAASDLLAAALAVYGLPLLVAVPAAALAWSLTASDGVAVAGALAGIVAGLWMGRRRLARAGCLARLRPVIRYPSGTAVASETP